MSEAVLSVGAEEPAGEVLRLLRDYPVHHLPVVADGRRVIGVLGTADLLKLRAMVPKSVVSAEEYLNQNMKVRTLISQPAVTIAEHETVERAAELMARHGIHSLPVVDSGGHLIGILTTTDIISAIFDGPPPRTDVVFEAHGRGARMTREHFSRTVALATDALDEGGDPDGFAAALVYAKYRIAVLETVARLAARYLASGQDVSLHTALGKAIEQARAAELSEQADEAPIPGLAPRESISAPPKNA